MAAGGRRDYGQVGTSGWGRGRFLGKCDSSAAGRERGQLAWGVLRSARLQSLAAKESGLR